MIRVLLTEPAQPNFKENMDDNEGKTEIVDSALLLFAR